MSRRGFFISVEGLPGSGKTTLIKGMVERLKKAKVENIVVTREPGGSEFGESLRRVLENHTKKHGPGSLDPMSELFTACAARVEHIRQTIAPAVKSGHVVISDTFLDNTYAYHVAHQHGHHSIVQALNDRSVGQFMPEHTFLIEGEPETFLRRSHAAQKREMPTPGEIEIAHRMRTALVHIAADDTRFFIVDGEKEKEVLLAEAWKLLMLGMKIRRIPFDWEIAEAFDKTPENATEKAQKGNK